MQHILTSFRKNYVLKSLKFIQIYLLIHFNYFQEKLRFKESKIYTNLFTISYIFLRSFIYGFHGGYIFLSSRSSQLNPSKNLWFLNYYGPYIPNLWLGFLFNNSDIIDLSSFDIFLLSNFAF